MEAIPKLSKEKKCHGFDKLTWLKISRDQISDANVHQEVPEDATSIMV